MTKAEEKVLKKRFLSGKITKTTKTPAPAKTNIAYQPRWKHRAALPQFSCANFLSPLRVHLEGQDNHQTEQEKEPESTQRAESLLSEEEKNTLVPPPLEIQQHIWSEWRHDEATDVVMDDATDNAMDKVTDDAMDKVTNEAMDKVTDEAMDKATNEETVEAMIEAMLEAMNEATDEAMNEATDEAMDHAMDDIVIGDIDYLLPTPETSPLLKPTVLQFNDLVRVQPIPLRRQVNLKLFDECYEGDPQFVAAVDNEIARRRNLRERMRAHYALLNNGEADGFPSEFKEEEDIMPQFDEDSPWLDCWPNDNMFERILDEEEEEERRENKKAEDASVKILLKDEETEANTQANKVIEPLSLEESSELKELPEDDAYFTDSSEFNEFPEEDYTPDHVKPLVAPLTSAELANLEQVAQHAATNDRAIVAELPAIKLTTHDFGTLVPTMFNGPAKGWLNDNIIDEYLDLLVSHVKDKEGYVHIRGKDGVAPPVHAMKSQWFTSMKKSPESTARWARPVNLAGEKLMDCNLVLIPICDHSHWRLIAIKPKRHLIEYYDSLRGTGSEYLDAANDWVKLVLQEKYDEELWYVAHEYQKSEKQVNARDCGVFTILNALVLLREEEHDRVDVTDGMEDARLRIAATLLGGRPTTEME